MSERAVDLELLQTFQAVYRSGSMTGAASALGLSQPAITARLQALERASGARLFVRGPRGSTPTTAADDLARRIEAPLGELASVVARLGRPTDLRETTLRVGAPAEHLERALATEVAAMGRTGMRVEVSLGLADELLARLADGRLDLVVSTVKPSDRTTWQVLADEEFHLVASPTLADEIDPDVLRSDPARALAAVARIAYDPQQSVLRRWWQHVLGERPPARPQITVPDLRSVLALVLSGAGVSALPDYLCGPHLASGELVELVVTDDPPINSFYLATMGHLRHQPHVAAAWELLTR